MIMKDGSIEVKVQGNKSSKSCWTSLFDDVRVTRTLAKLLAQNFIFCLSFHVSVFLASLSTASQTKMNLCIEEAI